MSFSGNKLKPWWAHSNLHLPNHLIYAVTIALINSPIHHNVYSWFFFFLSLLSALPEGIRVDKLHLSEICHTMSQTYPGPPHRAGSHFLTLVSAAWEGKGASALRDTLPFSSQQRGGPGLRFCGFSGGNKCFHIWLSVNTNKVSPVSD